MVVQNQANVNLKNRSTQREALAFYHKEQTFTILLSDQTSLFKILMYNLLLQSIQKLYIFYIVPVSMGSAILLLSNKNQVVIHVVDCFPVCRDSSSTCAVMPLMKLWVLVSAMAIPGASEVFLM